MGSVASVVPRDVQRVAVQRQDRELDRAHVLAAPSFNAPESVAGVTWPIVVPWSKVTPPSVEVNSDSENWTTPPVQVGIVHCDLLRRDVERAVRGVDERLRADVLLERAGVLGSDELSA